MNKRQRKKNQCKQPSKRERIKYWSKAYRNLSLELDKLERDYDFLMAQAIKECLMNKKLAEEVKALKEKIQRGEVSE